QPFYGPAALDDLGRRDRWHRHRGRHRLRRDVHRVRNDSGAAERARGWLLRHAYSDRHVLTISSSSDRCSFTFTSIREPRRLMIAISRSMVKRLRSELLRMREKSAAAIPVRACASRTLSRSASSIRRISAASALLSCCASAPASFIGLAPGPPPEKAQRDSMLSSLYPLTATRGRPAITVCVVRRYRVRREGTSDAVRRRGEMMRYRIIGISRNVRSIVCVRILSDAKLDERPATSMSSANIIPYASELGVGRRCYSRWPVASHEAACWCWIAGFGCRCGHTSVGVSARRRRPQTWCRMSSRRGLTCLETRPI